MFLSKVVMVILVLVIANSNSDHCPNSKTDLRSLRRRRHLTFIEGSFAFVPDRKTISEDQEDCRALEKTYVFHRTFNDDVVTITISLGQPFQTRVPSGWYTTNEMDVLFPMPPANFTNAHFRRKVHHRQKREFWERTRNILDMHNMDGYSCLLRTVCEVKTDLAPPGKSLVHDILRAIYTAPVHEEEFLEEMGETYNELSDPHFCNKVTGCPFSLVHFILELKKQKY